MLSREGFWDVAEFTSDIGPTVIRCDTDAWKTYFDDYTEVDAASIGRSELHGIDYVKRTHFKPLWLIDAERTNTLVLTNLDRVPVHSADPAEKTQIDFAHLIRLKDERDEYRELGSGSGVFVPQSLRVFIILPKGYAFAPFFFERCCQIKIEA